MSRSDWGIILAIVGCLVLASVGLWDSQQRSYYAEEKRHQQYRYAPDKPLEIDLTVTSVPNAQALEYRRPCENPKGKDESDLCAQWRAAKAAENSALWAKWGFCIAVVGSSFLLWQIILTRKAVKETGNATDAMREANEIARQAMQTQVRAYLSIKEAVCIIGKNTVRIALSIQNTGGSHSNNTVVRVLPQSVIVHHVDHGVMPEHTWTESPDVKLDVGVCPPGAICNNDDLLWPIVGFEGLQIALGKSALPRSNTRIRILFEGYIKWDDIFDLSQDIWITLAATDFERTQIGFVGKCEIRHRVHDTDAFIACVNQST